MKKTIDIAIRFAPTILSSILLFYISCSIVAFIFDYILVLYSDTITSLILTLLLVIVLILMIKNKIPQHKLNKIFSGMLLPFTFIVQMYFGIFAINESNILFMSVLTIVSLFLSAKIFFKYCSGKLKVIMICLSIPMACMIIFSFSLTFLLGDFGQTEMVGTIQSPDGTYVAETFNSNHGALGGASYAAVTKKKGNFPLLIGYISKRIPTISLGGWNSYQDTSLTWINDYTLKIGLGEFNFRDGIYGALE